MKRILGLVILLLSSLAFGTSSPITVTGTVTDASNNVATSGYVQFDLIPTNQALPYSIAGQTVIASSSKCKISATGTLVNYVTGIGSCTLWPNDFITPSNTLYTITIAPGGKVTRVYNNVLISSGTNPQDLSILTFIQPQPVIGTVIQANPLITMAVVPSNANTWTFGSATKPYLAMYAQYIYATYGIISSSLTLSGPLTLSSGGTFSGTFDISGGTFSGGTFSGGTFSGGTFNSGIFNGAFNGTVGATTPSTGVFTSTRTVISNLVPHAEMFSGATAAEQIAACLAVRGYCDATGYGATTQTLDAPISIVAGQTVIFSPDTKFVPASLSSSVITASDDGGYISGLTVNLSSYATTYTGKVINRTCSTGGPVNGFIAKNINISGAQSAPGYGIYESCTHSLWGNAFDLFDTATIYGLQNPLYMETDNSGTWINSNNFVNMTFISYNSGISTCITMNNNGNEMRGNYINYSCEGSGVGNGIVLSGTSVNAIKENRFDGNVWDDISSLTNSATAIQGNTFKGNFDVAINDYYNIIIDPFHSNVYYPWFNSGLTTIGNYTNNIVLKGPILSIQTSSTNPSMLFRPYDNSTSLEIGGVNSTNTGYTWKINNLGNPNFTGRTDGATSSTGNIGEYHESKIPVGSAVSLTTAIPATVTSIALTAGNWEVCGSVNFGLSSATTVIGGTWKVGMYTSSSSTPTMPTDGTEVYLQPPVHTTSTYNMGSSLACREISLSASSTLYLVAVGAFNPGTVTAWGTLNATRQF